MLHVILKQHSILLMLLVLRHLIFLNTTSLNVTPVTPRNLQTTHYLLNVT